MLLVQGCVLATRVGGDITGRTHAMGALVAIITVSVAPELDNAIDCKDPTGSGTTSQLVTSRSRSKPD